MVRRWWGRLGSLVAWRRLDGDVRREMAFHITMETERRVQAGMTPGEARRTALRDFGGVDRYRDAVRDTRGLGLWDALGQDVRFAIRTLGRSPGYTLVAVMILALGIGANAAVFSVINGVLIQPLPFHRGDRLMLLQQSAPGSGAAALGVGIPELSDYRHRLQAVRDLVEYHGMSFTLLDQGEPDRVNTGVVSANFFDMLGVRPILGRAFVDGDDEIGADAVLVLSHKYWMEKFGGVKDVVGKVVEMNNRPHTVVGVLPDIPQYPRENDVYMPTSACPFRARAARELPQGHRTFGVRVFGRLAEGTTVTQASAAMAVIAESFDDQFPKDYQRAKDFTGRVVPLTETLVTNARPMLLALSGTTILVLLIACANVANLALSRTVRRQRELAVRTALGAGRRRLLRMLVTESLIVSIAGGVLGLAFAWLAQGMLTSFIGRFTPRVGQIGMDGTVLTFVLVVSVLTGLVFGAAPALATRRNLATSMRDGSAASGEGSRRHRLRAALVVAQVAVSFVLLVGAALLLRSFARLSAVELGFDADRVMTASVFGNFTTVTADDQLRVNSEVLTRLRNAPGVTSAAVTASVPLSNIQPGQATVRLEGQTAADVRAMQADPNTASEGYFETLGIPIQIGRSFRESDRADAPPVAVINQSMAKFWTGANPVGSRFQIEGNRGPNGGANPWITVIGVVRDFHLYQVDTEVEPQFYLTFRQNGGFAGRVLVRTNGDPLDLVPVIKEAAYAIDPKSPVEDLLTLGALRSGKLEAPGLTAALLTTFAGIALVITLAGIGGVIATSVAQRTREFGLRMALGASRSSVLRLVLGQGLMLVAIGLTIGVAGAWLFSQLIKAYLFATPPTDLVAYGIVAASFVIFALAATVGPARRATTIDPLIALKTD